MPKKKPSKPSTARQRTRLEVVQEMRRQRGLPPYDPKALKRARRSPDLFRLPNWTIWKFVDEVMIWEGVALSLNLEPSKVRHDGYRDGAHTFRESQEFNDRMLFATRSSDAKLPRTERSNCSEDSKVALSQFAAWAQARWDIPSRLAALAKGGDSIEERHGRRRSSQADLDILARVYRVQP